MSKPDREGFAWLKLPAKMETLEISRAFILQKAREVSFPQEAIGKVELVFEELLVNIVNYAYPNDQTGIVEVGCGVRQKEFFCVQIRDRGRPFNPLSLAAPDLSQDIEERQIGGLGIHFVLQMVDDARYERAGEWNELTFCFELNG